MEHSGKSIRRPSEVITSLREKAEKQKGLIKVDKNARFCPAGHCLVNNVLLHEQQYNIQEQRQHQQHQRSDEGSIMPIIYCNGCTLEIVGEYISGCCKICNINFCDDCFYSGKSIEEMMEESRGILTDMISSGGEVSVDEITMGPTNEYCAAGHHLGRVSSILRSRYIQEQHGLDAPPAIECDCCSKIITNEHIAGCCFECDIDFCEDCFKSGQSYQDILEEDRTGPPEDSYYDDDNEYEGSLQHSRGSSSRGKKQQEQTQRYNHHRPTYKGTGRVNYDNYPDPTAYQWTFTGSDEISGVEYFEKDYGRIGIIKLDFYYAIGTARTILEHPVKGEKRLLGKQKSMRPNMYRKLLLDPKTHTDRFYRKKSKQVI